MHGETEFPVRHTAFHDGGITVFAHFGAASHHLRPAMLRAGRIDTELVHVRRNEKLAAGPVEQRAPHSAAGTLPESKIGRILRVFVGRGHVTGIVGGIVVEERDMAEGHEEWGFGDFRTLQGIFQPVCLGLTVFSALEKPGKNGIGVQFILGGIEAYEGDISHPHSEVAAQVPVAHVPLFGLAIHPNLFEMPVCPAAGIVVAGAEEIGRLGSVVLAFNGLFQEDAHLFFDGFLRIGSVSVPDHAGRSDRRHLVQHGAEGLPVGVSVVDDAETAVFQAFACRHETVCPGIFLISEHLHVVAVAVVDAVGADAVIVARGRFQAGYTHLDHTVFDVTETVTAAEHLAGVGQVRFFAYEHVSVGKGVYRECDTD